MDLKTIPKNDRRKSKIDIGTMIYGKIPPQAKDLEEAVLGAIMLDKRAFEIVSDILKSECFYIDDHQRIFQAMADLDKNNQPIDIPMVVEKLKEKGELELVGGPYYVTKLTNAVVSSANIEPHSQIILRKYVAREIIRISGEAINHAYDDSTDCYELSDIMQKEIDAVVTQGGTAEISDMAQNAKDFFEIIDKRRLTQETLTGVPSGFKQVDHLTWGWQPTDLIILAARPSVGKTAFALNLARNAALANEPVGFFTLEMSRAQCTERIFSIQSEINMDNFRKGRIDESQYKLLGNASRWVEKMKIYIDDSPMLTIIAFRRKARKLVREKKVKLIIIDYLQLMTGIDDNNTKNREQEISKISRGLKILAKELNIPIIALSQLSRGIETRQSGKAEPQLSDLRESGAIEQDADVVMFIYRAVSDVHLPGETWLKFSKHRNGILGTIKIIGQLHKQTFYDIDDPRAKDETGIIRPVDFTVPTHKDGSFDEGFSDNEKGF